MEFKLGSITIIDRNENGRLDFHGTKPDIILDNEGRRLSIFSPQFKKVLEDLGLKKVNSFLLRPAADYLLQKEIALIAAQEGDPEILYAMQEGARQSAKQLRISFNEDEADNLLFLALKRGFSKSLENTEFVMIEGSVEVALAHFREAKILAEGLEKHFRVDVQKELQEVGKKLFPLLVLFTQKTLEMAGQFAISGEVDSAETCLRRAQRIAKEIGLHLSPTTIKAIQEVAEVRAQWKKGNRKTSALELTKLFVKMWAQLGDVQKVEDCLATLSEIQSRISGNDGGDSLKTFRWQYLGLAYGRAFENAIKTVEALCILGEPEGVEQSLREAKKWAELSEEKYQGLHSFGENCENYEEYASGILQETYRNGMRRFIWRANFDATLPPEDLTRKPDVFLFGPHDPTLVQSDLSTARFYASLAGETFDESKAETILKSSLRRSLEENFRWAQRAAELGETKKRDEYLEVARYRAEDLEIPFDKKRADAIRKSKAIEKTPSLPYSVYKGLKIFLAKASFEEDDDRDYVNSL